jgi:hypothetical protein
MTRAYEVFFTVCALYPLLAAQVRILRILFQVPEAVVANPHHHLVGESPVPASVPGHAGRRPPAEMGIETETIPKCQWFTAVKRIVNLQLWLFTQPISSENGEGLAILGSLFK